MLRSHVVVMAGFGAVGLAAVGAGEGGAVHLAGRLPTASLVVLVAHEAGEGSPAPLGVRCRVSGRQRAMPCPAHVLPIWAAPLTSWGQRSLPICFSTLRSRSRSSCSLPSEASSEGWGAGPASVPHHHKAPAPAQGSGPRLSKVGHGSH